MNKNGISLLRRIAVFAMVLGLLLSVPGIVHADSTDAVRNDADSVLQLNCIIKDDFGNENKLSTGTCFLINQDTVLTCYHCVDVDNAAKLAITLVNYGISLGSFTQLTVDKLVSRISFSVTIARDVTIPATYLNGSEEMDFAILKLSQPIKNKSALNVRSSSDMKAAETVYALGYPGNSDYSKVLSTYTKDDVTTSQGIVSKIQGLYAFGGEDSITIGGEKVYYDDWAVSGQFVQTSCPLSGGNSGGPMVDNDGNVFGIASIGQGNEYYFGVAIDQVTEVLDALGIEYSKAGSSTVKPTDAPAEPTAEPTSTDKPITEKLDYSALETAIRNIELRYYEKGQKSNYTEKSFAELEIALTLAKEINGNAANQEAIDSAVSKLNLAEYRLEEKGKSSLLYIIIAIVAAVVVAAVVVVILLSNKKKASSKKSEASRPKQPSGYTAASGPLQTSPSFKTPQAAPARPNPTVQPASKDSGATTILQGQVSATTMLANGGSITRVKNGDKLDLKVQEVLIGRDPAVCNFHITGNTNIGRKHAKFVVKNGVTYIVDQNSTNGTFVNGARIQPNVEIALKNGDKIMLADEEFSFNK